MNAFDSVVGSVSALNAKMKKAALSNHWDSFKGLDHERQSMLRLLRYENYRNLVSVEKFSNSIETLLNDNSELVAIVESHRNDAAVGLKEIRSNRHASDAYSNI